MANPEHVEILKQGVEVWNKWRKENQRIFPYLTGVNLPAAVLTDADLTRANLRNAVLSRANLNGANLRNAFLSGADLTEAYLRGANLTRTYLDRADLTRADLVEATLAYAFLSHTNLAHANLTKANLYKALFSEVTLTETNLSGATLRGSAHYLTGFALTNLKNAIGLDSCRHDGPSPLDFHTLQKSWPLPLSFLRGCGLPDTYIDFLPSLLESSAFQFYSCFISYSAKDEEFANRLYADLQNNGVRCWFAPEEMQGGKFLHDQIDSAIRVHDKLILILSEHSMQSPWVKTELRKALKNEQSNQEQKLFPLALTNMKTIQEWECFDADFGEDLAAKVREYFIPDFSNWKQHDSYQKAFERLLRDLKEEKKPDA